MGKRRQTERARKGLDTLRTGQIASGRETQVEKVRAKRKKHETMLGNHVRDRVAKYRC